MHSKAPSHRPGLYAILLFLSVMIMQHSVLAENSISATVVTTNSSTAVSSTPAAETSQNSLSPIQVGPLEIRPGKVFIRLPVCNGTVKCLDTTIRFKVKNTSAADVKFLLFKNSFVITDNFGSPLYRQNSIKGGGLNLSEAKSGDFQRAFMDEKAKLTTINPNQIIEAQIIPDNSGIELRSGNYNNTLDFYMSHKPKAMTLSAVIGIQTIEETSQIHSFSLSDIPIQINE